MIDFRRQIRVIAAPVAMVALVACGAEHIDAPPPQASGAVVILAVGDTGAELVEGAPKRGQLLVGRAMARRDVARRVRALLFLGDNFYPDGLLEDEFEPRVRGNLAIPYCHFSSARVARYPVLRDCGVAPDERNSVPWFAVAGNHDHRDSSSVLRQRAELPARIPNWDMGEPASATDPISSVQVFEPAAEVSLIALDSTVWLREPDGERLVKALKRARGPWRLLAMHHPVAPARDGGYTESADFRRFQHEVGSAIVRAGVPVQLVLSGHDHYLAATSIAAEVGAVADRDVLNVIAGSGSSTRHQSTSDKGLLVRESILGFAELEFEPERLRVSLLAVERDETIKQVARFDVQLDGSFQRSSALAEPGMFSRLASVGRVELALTLLAVGATMIALRRTHRPRRGNRS